jgi:hypothetical protein
MQQVSSWKLHVVSQNCVWARTRGILLPSESFKSGIVTFNFAIVANDVKRGGGFGLSSASERAKQQWDDIDNYSVLTIAAFTKADDRHSLLLKYVGAR